ncbi:MAG: DNA polymerase III subunit epsilon [Gammaproteobacteria bacterium]|nr:DNA polymerase III subunit epsilon [Gammaproteobacteria bacterium]
MRQIVLDTETTGLDWAHGHRVIEIGCVELINRRRTGNTYHVYLNPERDIDEGAVEVHGLTTERLANEPLFKAVANDLLHYLGDAELVIHNAPFDVGFLDNEFRIIGRDEHQLSKDNPVLDTLVLARQMNPGQRNSLDALCKRYGVDNSSRNLHGALLDAELLADVYLMMTGGQTRLSLGEQAGGGAAGRGSGPGLIDREGLNLVALDVPAEDVAAHEQQLDLLDEKCDEGAVWRRSG